MSTSNSEARAVYAVIGGTSPGAYDHPPFLTNSPSSPIMPIVIKCTTNAEANTAYGLHAVFKNLECETANNRPEAFAKSIAMSSEIPDLFATAGPFYAVYKGRQRAIYVKSFEDCQAQIHDFHYPRFHAFMDIKEALVYMILKGNIEKMKELGLYSRAGVPSGRTMYTNVRSRAESTLGHEQIPHSGARPAPQSTEGQRVRPIYSHIRDFTGIIDTIYGSSSAPLVYLSYGLGKHAGYYLQAHGYTDSTIKKIEEIWMRSGSSVDTFVDLLSAHGVATTEGRWLWDMINHDDDCGF
ncbi:hypothetical protein C8F04DRAFT_1262650 [Mycena alexandri]|uniref:Ribonuclease H1 N-terminal domain-containing protein n=1 Tax=Mycena alexandri TaxID=1745969 RepID=A0AAD6X0Z6_9AGAR|nr:hypothetical protein C8F04DRAFT_1262650 [Mycena alexandri]